MSPLTGNPGLWKACNVWVFSGFQSPLKSQISAPSLPSHRLQGLGSSQCVLVHQEGLNSVGKSHTLATNVCCLNSLQEFLVSSDLWIQIKSQGLTAEGLQKLRSTTFNDQKVAMHQLTRQGTGFETCWVIPSRWHESERAQLPREGL